MKIVLVLPGNLKNEILLNTNFIPNVKDTVWYKNEYYTVKGIMHDYDRMVITVMVN